MPKALIKIAYRQVIAAGTQSNFEKNVLHFSYEEYKLKQQAYNTDGSITSFTALKQKDGRANSLHYKSGFAVAGFIEALHNSIKIVQDGSEYPFAFDTYKFEVLESDITDVQQHRVAIQYISGTLTLYEIIGEYMLVAKGDRTLESSNDAAETWLVKVQPGMQVVSYIELIPQDQPVFIDHIM